MKRTEYVEFLEKKIKEHKKKRLEAELNYQETGNKSYYNTMVKNEYYEDALTAALRAENNKNVIAEEKERMARNLRLEVERYKANYTVEEALDKVISSLENAEKLGIF